MAKLTAAQSKTLSKKMTGPDKISGPKRPKMAAYPRSGMGKMMPLSSMGRGC